MSAPHHPRRTTAPARCMSKNVLQYQTSSAHMPHFFCSKQSHACQSVTTLNTMLLCSRTFGGYLFEGLAADEVGAHMFEAPYAFLMHDRFADKVNDEDAVFTYANQVRFGCHDWCTLAALEWLCLMHSVCPWWARCCIPVLQHRSVVQRTVLARATRSHCRTWTSACLHLGAATSDAP
jgi:hypothetical protein